jgi:hypothetical protein
MQNETDVFGVEKTVVTPLVCEEDRDNKMATTHILCSNPCTGTTCLCATPD